MAWCKRKYSCHPVSVAKQQLCAKVLKSTVGDSIYNWNLHILNKYIRVWANEIKHMSGPSSECLRACFNAQTNIPGEKLYTLKAAWSPNKCGSHQHNDAARATAKKDCILNDHFSELTCTLSHVESQSIGLPKQCRYSNVVHAKGHLSIQSNRTGCQCLRGKQLW